MVIQLPPEFNVGNTKQQPSDKQSTNEMKDHTEAGCRAVDHVRNALVIRMEATPQN